MKQFVSMVVIAFGCSGCWYLAAVPRHTEIKRPVTSQEIVGRWVLTTNSLKSVMVDGFTLTNGEEVVIAIRTNGSYSSHAVLLRWDEKRHVVDRMDKEGQWSLRYQPTNFFKNTLELRNSVDLWVAQDSQKMILWSSWGDPDDGIDLVYEKMQEQ